MRVFRIIAVSFAFTACTTEVTGPSNLEGLPEGLDVHFTVAPAEVEQRESFAVRLTVTNTTSDTIRVVTAHGCLALPSVIRNGERIPFVGTALGCTAAITSHTFAPGEEDSRTWTLRSELYAQSSGEVDGVPAPVGTYRVLATFDTYSDDGPQQKPMIEQTLRVR